MLRRRVYADKASKAGSKKNGQQTLLQLLSKNEETGPENKQDEQNLNSKIAVDDHESPQEQEQEQKEEEIGRESQKENKKPVVLGGGGGAGERKKKSGIFGVSTTTNEATKTNTTTTVPDLAVAGNNDSVVVHDGGLAAASAAAVASPVARKSSSKSGSGAAAAGAKSKSPTKKKADPGQSKLTDTFFVTHRSSSSSSMGKKSEETAIIPSITKETQMDKLLQSAYHLAIPDARKLNKYRPWTPEVYGETLGSLIHDFIDAVPIRDGDVFVDLGSGVGQVVLAVAAHVRVKLSFGIEREKHLADSAEKLHKAFLQQVQQKSDDENNNNKLGASGLLADAVEIIEGDFFQNERLKEVLPTANVVFINNKAFGPQVDGGLVRDVLPLLPDGAKVISFVRFIHTGSGRTRAASNSAGGDSWLPVTHKGERPDAVSWTSTPIAWYVHTVRKQNYYH